MPCIEREVLDVKNNGIIVFTCAVDGKPCSRSRENRCSKEEKKLW